MKAKKQMFDGDFVSEVVSVVALEVDLEIASEVVSAGEIADFSAVVVRKDFDLRDLVLDWVLDLLCDSGLEELCSRREYRALTELFLLASPRSGKSITSQLGVVAVCRRVDFNWELIFPPWEL